MVARDSIHTRRRLVLETVYGPRVGERFAYDTAYYKIPGFLYGINVYYGVPKAQGAKLD